MKDYFWGSKEEEKEVEPTSIHQLATETKAHASTDNNVVEFSHNRIYFYSGVTRPKILQLNKGIYNLNINMLSRLFFQLLSFELSI